MCAPCYYCGWQQIPLLDEGWRPDKSGVLLLPVKKTSGMPQGMEFMIRGRAAAVRRPGFAEFVAFLISKGAAVFLSVAGRRAQLNGSLREAVAARNMEAVRQLLLRLHAGPPRTEIGMCRRRCSNRLLNRVGFQRRHVRVVLVDHQIAAE